MRNDFFDGESGTLLIGFLRLLERGGVVAVDATRIDDRHDFGGILIVSAGDVS